MSLDESLKKIESNLRKINLGGLLKDSNQINILDRGLSEPEQEKIQIIKEYLTDLTDKTININIINYETFIQNILGMSFENYVNKIKKELETKQFNFAEAVRETEEIIRQNNATIPEGNYWMNYGLNSLLRFGDLDENSQKDLEMSTFNAIKILNTAIPMQIKKRKKEITLTDLSTLNWMNHNDSSREIKQELEPLYLEKDISRTRFRNALDYLREELGGIRHGVGTKQNEDFIEYLNREYSKETQQSMFSKMKFGFVSDRLPQIEGKLDVIRTKSINTIDLTKYAAIFIDNEYNFYSPLPRKISSKLGKGIKTLQKINEFKSDNMPLIFYQTAHNLEHICEEDKQIVASLGNAILLPKNVAPKFSFDESIAKKELETSKILSENEELFQYTAQTLQVNDGKPFSKKIEETEYFITLSKSANTQKINEQIRKEILQKTGLKDNEINTKMYVLGMFHKQLKSEVNNPVFQKPNVDFYEFKEIKKDILPSFNKDLDEYEQMYNSIIQKHRDMTPTTISHNDAKWDNWFGKILGDYGQASIGTEYKDVARSLFERETIENNKLISKKTIDTAIDSYIALRKSNSENYDVNVEEFRQNVYEMIFTESLRLAKYESIHHSEKLVQGLLTNARYMHNLLGENYKNIGILVKTVQDTLIEDEQTGQEFNHLKMFFQDRQSFQELKENLIYMKQRVLEEKQKKKELEKTYD